MKSSKDIPPRVGMQVHFLDADIAITSLETAPWPGDSGDGFEGVVLANRPDAYDAPGARWQGGIHSWNGGHYRVTWQPPTDDERRLFMERRTHPDGFGHIGRLDSMKWVFDGHPADCPYCNRNWREIAESLALDGADYDNMPDFEELER